MWQGPGHFHDTQSGWIQYCVINHWGNGGNQLTNCAKLQIVLVCAVAERVLFVGPGKLQPILFLLLTNILMLKIDQSRTQRFVFTSWHYQSKNHMLSVYFYFRHQSMRVPSHSQVIWHFKCALAEFPLHSLKHIWSLPMYSVSTSSLEEYIKLTDWGPLGNRIIRHNIFK